MWSWRRCSFTIFLMTIAYRAFPNKVTTGEQGMIGLVGEARTPLSPHGKIFVNGELWNARSALPVEAGTPVVVRKVEGLELEVEPASQTATAKS